MRYRIVSMIVFFALSLLAVPRAPAAPPAENVVRIGMLSIVNPRTHPAPAAFVQGLEELGYVEGQSLRIEFRNAEGKPERLPALAAELVRLPVDVLVAVGPEVTLRAAQNATRTIPIVMVAVDYDPMALGYIAGLSRPGGNITGLFLQPLELTGKRLELLKEAVPQLTRVAVLWDAISADQFRAATEAARVLGVHVQSLELRDPPAYDIEGALGAAARERAGALLALMSPIIRQQQTRITALAVQYGLPTIAGFLGFAQAGGLMFYGPSNPDMNRRAADYVDRILKGAKPADLPVEQPTKFELVLNLKTAKALGITIPPSLLVFADEVIQ
jgi:putative tryptophan/tyrosine transport system substrate-binding protein